VLALKIRTAQKCSEIEGCVIMMKLLLEILPNISHRFLTPNYSALQRASSLYNEFSQVKENYFGSPLTDDLLFDTELVG